MAPPPPAQTSSGGPSRNNSGNRGADELIAQADLPADPGLTDVPVNEPATTRAAGRPLSVAEVVPVTLNEITKLLAPLQVSQQDILERFDRMTGRVMALEAKQSAGPSRAGSPTAAAFVRQESVGPRQTLTASQDARLTQDARFTPDLKRRQVDGRKEGRQRQDS